MQINSNNLKLVENYIESFFTNANDAVKIAALANHFKEAIYNKPKIIKSDFDLFFANPKSIIPDLNNLDSEFTLKLAIIGVIDYNINKSINNLPTTEQFYFDEELDYDISQIDWNFKKIQQYLIKNETPVKNHKFDDYFIKLYPKNNINFLSAHKLISNQKSPGNCIT